MQNNKTENGKLIREDLGLFLALSHILQKLRKQKHYTNCSNYRPIVLNISSKINKIPVYPTIQKEVKQELIKSLNTYDKDP